MTEEARAVAQRLREYHNIHEEAADTIDALVQEVERLKQEPYWMIECSDGFVGWWTGAGEVDCRKFSTDPTKGKRFKTKADAEAAIHHTCQIATEHLDMPIAPKQEQTEQCKHRIADARNHIVQSGYICVDCGALFSAADHHEKQEQAEPFGIVVEHRTGGMWFYQWGQPPYLDNAIKHWVVYTAPQGQTALREQIGNQAVNMMEAHKLLRQALEAMSDIRYVSDYTHIVALCESIKQHLGEA